jgi:hypothetical protein
LATYAGTGIRRVGTRIYPTVLVRHVRLESTGTYLADHLWFNRGESWRRADLVKGDRIILEARAIEYRTGYWGTNKLERLNRPPRVEYKLTPPKRIAIARRADSRPKAA